jgi:hypothetical protein
MKQRLINLGYIVLNTILWGGIGAMLAWRG